MKHYEPLQFLALSSLLSVGFLTPAHADFDITALQLGPDLVFSYSGSVDLTGAPLPSGAGSSAFINPGAPALSFTSYAAGAVDTYLLPSPPPAFPVFGTLGAHFPTSNTGGILRLSGASTPHELSLPDGYVSNSLISGSMTFSGSSFTSLGLTPGSYVWDLTFTGGPSQKATITIVPEPSTFALLGLAGLGLLRRQR
jgi:hypothetical protein